MIRTDVTNAACRRVAEKCGGVMTGYEPTLASKAIAALMESYGNKLTDDEDMKKKKKKNADFIEDEVTLIYFIKWFRRGRRGCL